MTAKQTRRQAVDHRIAFDTAEQVRLERDNLATEVERLRDVIRRGLESNSDLLRDEYHKLVGNEEKVT
jgi:hypothetical protein